MMQHIDKHQYEVSYEWIRNRSYLQGFVNIINGLIEVYNSVAWLWGSHIDPVSNIAFDYADKIRFIIGDANELAPTLGVKFDMAFLDGDKRTYLDTFNRLLPLMNPGALILADNTLWDGHVVDHAYDNDRQTSGIEQFNDFIANDPRVTRVMLPLRDGLTMIRVKWKCIAIAQEQYLAKRRPSSYYG